MMKENEIEKKLAKQQLQYNDAEQECSMKKIFHLLKESNGIPYEESINYLFNSEISINECNEYDQTRLHYASEIGRVDAVIHLLEHGANIDITDRHSETPLYHAVKNENIEVVKILLEYGAKFKCGYYFRSSPLYAAMHISGSNKLKMVMMLLDNKVNAPYINDKPPLHWAIRRGNKNLIKILIELGANVNQTVGETTPLQAAIKIGISQKEIIRILLNNGADVNETCYSRTPLELAAECNYRDGYIEIFKILLEYGSHTNICRGPSLLYWFSGKSDGTEVIKALLEHGDNADKVEYQRSVTPLHHAAENGCNNNITTLLEHGASVDKPDSNGKTPLHHAAAERSINTIIILLENGANVGKTDNDGQTPLHHAVSKHSLDNIRILLEYGSYIDNIDKYGITPLYKAINKIFFEAAFKKEYMQVIRFLLECGADVNKTGCSQTPLHYAAKAGLTEVVMVLIDYGADISGYYKKFLGFGEYSRLMKELNHEMCQLIINYKPKEPRYIELEYHHFRSDNIKRATQIQP